MRCIRTSLLPLSLPLQVMWLHFGKHTRLTSFSPDIIGAILDGRHPAEITLAVLMRPFVMAWREQQMAIGSVSAVS